MMSKILSEIKNFLLDMDGTLYLGNHLFDSTPVFLSRIRESGRKLLFLTNNSSRSTAEYCQKLLGMGLQVEEREIFTSATATIIYLKNNTDYRRLFLLAVSSVEEMFRSEGYEITDQSPDAVILCFDKTLTYQKLSRACHLIMQGVPYIATHADFVCPTEELPIPDAGSIIEMIKTATGGKMPKVIGKPNRKMIDSALVRLGAKADETAIVGDRIYTDMEVGYRTELTTILVLSGETKKENLIHLTRQPDYVVESIGDLTDRLK